MTRSVPRRSFIRRSAIAPVVLGLAAAAPWLSAPTSALAASTSATFTPWWVQNFQPTHLWSGPSGSAVDYGLVPQWSYFQVVSPQKTPRLYVYVPWTKNYAYVESASVGPSGPPPPGWTQTMAVETSSALSATNWNGRVIGSGLAKHAAPSVQSPVTQTLPTGAPLQVVAWVIGDEVVAGDWTWAKLVDGTFAYGDAMQIVPPTAPPPLPASHPSGQWVDVHLLFQTAVAYQDSTPQHLAIVSTGSPGWETPLGPHPIQRRVANETMVGSSLNHLGMDAWHANHTNYDLANVLFTQYFDEAGDALHDNYWLPSTKFGIPHSHGCVGMQLADAQWFWNWATTGVPVVVRTS